MILFVLVVASIFLIPFQNCSQFSASIINANETIIAAADKSILIFYANDLRLSHQIGQANQTDWLVLSGRDDPNKFLNYGPYLELDAGYKKVIFDLEILNIDPENNAEQKVVTLDIFDSTNNRLITSKDIWFEDLKAKDSEYSIVFNAIEKTKYEFRTFWHGGFDLKLKKIIMKPADFGRFGDLFAHQYTFKKVAAMPGGNGWMVSENDIWYHFDRNFNADSTIPNFCSANGTLAIVVRSSRDKGKTWSSPKVAVMPSFKFGDDDACMAVDGATFFNSSTGQWNIFSQCQGGTATHWKMCLYESDTIEGPYRRKDIHFQPGQLWSQICTGLNKSCPPNVFDEGTPDYLYSLRGWHYFTFHGYDGVNGYRGMARTKDFITWSTTGPELADDALLTAADCQSWNPGCIGAGHASHIKLGDFIYMLWEGPTINLACTDGQYWPFGLSRSYKFERAKNWETGPMNPYLAPTGNDLCGTQYARFFSDGNDLYLYYDYAVVENGHRSEKFYLYKLVRTDLPVEAPIRYQGINPLLKHIVGSASGTTWEALASDTGFLSYGPYATNWANFYRQIRFTISAQNILLTSKERILKIDLYDATSNQVLEEKIIYENEILFGEIPTTISLPMPFFTDLTGHKLEARVYVYGKRAVKLHSIEVE